MTEETLWDEIRTESIKKTPSTETVREGLAKLLDTPSGLSRLIDAFEREEKATRKFWLHAGSLVRSVVSPTSATSTGADPKCAEYAAAWCHVPEGS